MILLKLTFLITFIMSAPTVDITDNSHAPCGVCDLTVGWENRALACETCGLWYHASCVDIGASTHQALEDSDCSWHCPVCSNYNPSQTAFDLFGLEQEILSSSTASGASLPSTASNFKPLHSSTPSRASQQNKQRDRPLRFLNVNLQSASAKRASIPHLFDSLRPDVVIATETWLDSSINSNEFMPDGFSTVRRDRNKHGGGVLIAVREGVQFIVLEDLSTNCEILWVKLIPSRRGDRPTVICAYYRPDVSDEPSLKAFEESLQKAAPLLRSSNVIIAGDLNFPGFDWDHTSIKPSTPHAGLHKRFLDLLHDHSLVQLVTFPTRGDNTLDLVVTNIPHLIPRVEPVPGVSDHEVVYFEYKARVTIRNGPPRSIPLYGKASWDQLRCDMVNLRSRMEEMAPSSTTEELWTVFKEQLQSSTTTHIPHKTSRRKAGQPWITSELRRLIRKRDRKYKQWKKIGTEQFRTEFVYLRREVQKQLRRAYWNYVGRLFEPTSEEDTNTPSSKRFWTYMKHQRATSSGVPPLKQNGQLVTDPKEKADLLNSQFYQAFSDGR